MANIKIAFSNEISGTPIWLTSITTIEFEAIVSMLSENCQHCILSGQSCDLREEVLIKFHEAILKKMVDHLSLCEKKGSKEPKSVFQGEILNFYLPNRERFFLKSLFVIQKLAEESINNHINLTISADFIGVGRKPNN